VRRSALFLLLSCRNSGRRERRLAAGEKMSVQVKTGQLRSKPRFWAASSQRSPTRTASPWREAGSLVQGDRPRVAPLDPQVPR